MIDVPRSSARQPGWAALSPSLPWLDNAQPPHRLLQSTAHSLLCKVGFHACARGMENPQFYLENIPAEILYFLLVLLSVSHGEGLACQAFDTIDVLCQDLKGILDRLGTGHIHAGNFEYFHGRLG